MIRYENNQVPQTLKACNAIGKALHIQPVLLFDDYLKFISSDYGTKIKQTRQKAGLSQREFGSMVGVTKKTIGKWERGGLIPFRKNYQRLISYLTSE